MSIFRSLTVATIRRRTGGRVGNAILASCAKEVLGKPESKIRFATRPDAQHFRADQARTTHRHCDRCGLGLVRIGKTLVANQAATGSGRNDIDNITDSAAPKRRD